MLNLKKNEAQNIKKIWESLKRSNLQIIGIEEGEETSSKAWKTFLKNHRRKFPHSKRGGAYQTIRSIKNFKKTEPKKVFSTIHNNQNTKCTQQRKNIKSHKGERPSNIQRQN